MSSVLGNSSLLRRSLLYVATLTFCCTLAHAAPDAAANAAVAASADKSDQPAGDNASKEIVDLGNITVTAQSRTQEVQSVPIAVQIVTQKQIDALAATDLSRMNGYV